MRVVILEGGFSISPYGPKPNLRLWEVSGTCGVLSMSKTKTWHKESSKQHQPLMATIPYSVLPTGGKTGAGPPTIGKASKAAFTRPQVWDLC